MSKFNFTGIIEVVKALHSTITKDNTKSLIISDRVKNGIIIKFRNGSYIKFLNPKRSVKDNRAKLYPNSTEDFVSDWYIDKETFDEILAPLCKEKENNNIDGQILYASRKMSC